ncbi:hypothetical protein D9M69_557860 [compost metagenome]
MASCYLRRKLCQIGIDRTIIKMSNHQLSVAQCSRKDIFRAEPGIDARHGSGRYQRGITTRRKSNRNRCNLIGLQSFLTAQC